MPISANPASSPARARKTAKEEKSNFLVSERPPTVFAERGGGVTTVAFFDPIFFGTSSNRAKRQLKVKRRGWCLAGMGSANGDGHSGGAGLGQPVAELIGEGISSDEVLPG